MKRSEHIIFKRSYRKRKSQSSSRLGLLFFLLGLLSLFVISEKSSFLLSLIKPISVEKVFAIQDVPDASFLTTITPTPPASPLFDARSLTVATPTPTPDPQQVLTTTTQGDFCLDVPILIYHHVQPLAEANAQGHAQLTVDSGIFDEQMSYLVSHGYTTISSDQVVAALLAHQQLPQKSIVVTLDDGYDDAYNYSFPIAKKYNVKMDFISNYDYITYWNGFMF